MGNPAVMQGHNLLYITLGLLIALGGIGFPILVNLYETVAYYLQAGKFWLLRRSGRFRKKVHLYNLNTKIVLVATVFLLIGGTLAIAALEWNHSFRACRWQTSGCMLSLIPLVRELPVLPVWG